MKSLSRLLAAIVEVISSSVRPFGETVGKKVSKAINITPSKK